MLAWRSMSVLYIAAVSSAAVSTSAPVLMSIALHGEASLGRRWPKQQPNQLRQKQIDVVGQISMQGQRPPSNGHIIPCRSLVNMLLPLKMACIKLLMLHIRHQKHSASQHPQHGKCISIGPSSDALDAWSHETPDIRPSSSYQAASKLSALSGELSNTGAGLMRGQIKCSAGLPDGSNYL